MENAQQPYLADIYSRLGALSVDGIILGSVRLLLGLVFESVFVKMGQWGALFGLIIMLLYFGIGNSQWSDGQTLGKKLLKIQGVDSNGALLGKAQALIRALVFITPFAVNGQAIFGDNPPDILFYVLSVIVLGGMLSVIYLFFFNRNSRQSSRDLAVKSIVINKNADKQPVAPIWKGHLIVVALLFITTAAMPAFTTEAQSDNPLLEKLIGVQKTLLAEPNISSVGVHQNTHTFNDDDDGSQEVIESLTIQMDVTKNQIKDEDFAKDIAKTAYSSYALANELDVVYVSLSYGYSIGIASKFQSYNYEFEVSELTE